MTTWPSSEITISHGWALQQQLAGTETRVVFDVGAYEGTTCRMYLKLFPDATIYAFDPTPHPRLLQGTRDVERLKLYRLALAARPGHCTFHVFDEYPMCNSLLPVSEQFHKEIGRGRTAEIEVITLDFFCDQEGIDWIDVLKIDAQGGDLDVLRGGHGMLEDRRVNVIYLEMLWFSFYKDQCMCHEIVEYLTGLGYHYHGLASRDMRNGVMRHGDGIFSLEGLV